MSILRRAYQTSIDLTGGAITLNDTPTYSMASPNFNLSPTGSIVLSSGSNGNILKVISNGPLDTGNPINLLSGFETAFPDEELTEGDKVITVIKAPGGIYNTIKNVTTTVAGS